MFEIFSKLNLYTFQTTSTRPKIMVSVISLDMAVILLRHFGKNPVLDENGFAAEDLAQVYNKNYMNRHVVFFL